jgi:hypothetical protein
MHRHPRLNTITYTFAQILSITCDNTSNNDTMIQALGELINMFSGEARRTCCFEHIVNLIAKSIIQQFDVPKTKKEEALDKAAQELMVLAGDLDKEECVTRDSPEVGDDDNININGWVDKLGKMSEREQERLNKDIQPVQWMLVKVHQCSLIHSFSTFIWMSYSSSTRWHMCYITVGTFTQHGLCLQ